MKDWVEDQAVTLAYLFGVFLGVTLVVMATITFVLPWVVGVTRLVERFK